MEPLPLDTSVRVESGVLNKLVGLAGELLVARDRFRAVCETTPTRAAARVSRAPSADVRVTLVLFRTPDAGQMAIPLADVDRIEEFPAEAVFEQSGQTVVLLSGRLLPLVWISALLPERRARPRHGDANFDPGRRMQVIVHTAKGRSVGLVVDRLLDVVDEQLVQAQPGSRSGARACVLLGQRVTELVDLEAVLESVAPSFRKAWPAPEEA